MPLYQLKKEKLTTSEQMKGFLNMRSRISPFFMHVLYCLAEQPIRKQQHPYLQDRLWINCLS